MQKYKEKYKQMHSFWSILIFVTKRKNRSDYNNKAFLFMDGWDEEVWGCLIYNKKNIFLIFFQRFLNQATPRPALKTSQK